MHKPDPYFIEAAARILDVLSLFENREEVRLADVVEELGLIKSTAFRLLYTLERKGYIEHVEGGRSYRKKQPRRLGLASISATIPFVAEVERSIETAARKAGFEVLIRHHEFLPERLLGDVEDLIASGIGALLCYNPDEHISHVIADRCNEARVPVIAITFPVPGARLFGINNYRAGLVGGEGLGEHVARRWRASLDLAVLLDIPGTSPAQQARMTGMAEGLRRNVRVPPDRLLHLHTDRQRLSAEALIRGVLDQNRSAKRIAVMSYNDANALGALRAVESLDRSEEVIILSQGGVAEVRRQIQKPGSALWGAVAHFPEKFGERLIPFVSRVLAGQSAGHTLYTEHVLLTRSTMSRYYP